MFNTDTLPRDLILSGRRDDSESLTPAKLAVGLLIRDYSQATKIHMEGQRPKYLSAKQRKKFALLALKLTQGCDISLSGLVSTVLDDKWDVPRRVLQRWGENLSAVIKKEVGGIMELMEDLQKMYTPEQNQDPHTNKSSILGIHIIPR